MYFGGQIVMMFGVVVLPRLLPSEPYIAKKDIANGDIKSNGDIKRNGLLHLQNGDLKHNGTVIDKVQPNNADEANNNSAESPSFHSKTD